MTKHEIDFPGHPDYGKYDYIFDQEEFNSLKQILSDLIKSTEMNCDESRPNCDVWDYGLDEGRELLKKLNAL